MMLLTLWKCFRFDSVRLLEQSLITNANPPAATVLGGQEDAVYYSLYRIMSFRGDSGPTSAAATYCRVC